MCRWKALGLGGWLRSLAFAAVALLAPPLVSAAMHARHAAAALCALLGPAQRARARSARARSSALC